MNILNKVEKKTQQIFFTIVGLNIIAAILCAGLFFMIAKKESSTLSIISEIQKEYIKVEKIKSTENIFKDTYNERKQLDTYFVTQDTVVDFIESIEWLGAYAGIEIVLDGVDVTTGDNAKLAIKVSTKGDWEDTIYFLALSEYFPANVNIDSAKITKIGDIKDNNKQWSGEFFITVLSFIDEHDE